MGVCFSQLWAKSCGRARVLVSLGYLSHCCMHPFSSRGALAERGEPALRGARVVLHYGATLHFTKWDVSVIYRATVVQICFFLVLLLAYKKPGPNRLQLCVEAYFLFRNQILTYEVHSRVSVV